MARYTEPRCRLCRRLGEKLYLKGEKCYTKCIFDKRPFPPGPRQTRRRKVSDRGLQWREKQKARAVYGILESQFRKYYEEAVRRPGVTGETLLCARLSCARTTSPTAWGSPIHGSRRGNSFRTGSSRSTGARSRSLRGSSSRATRYRGRARPQR